MVSQVSTISWLLPRRLHRTDGEPSSSRRSRTSSTTSSPASPGPEPTASGTLGSCGLGVVVNHPELGDSTIVVKRDGTFKPNRRGVLAFVARTTITFTISAVDAEGVPIEGEIVVTS
jgi:hypothetical protein